jgi:hypothetical protein
VRAQKKGSGSAPDVVAAEGGDLGEEEEEDMVEPGYGTAFLLDPVLADDDEGDESFVGWRTLP